GWFGPGHPGPAQARSDRLRQALSEAEQSARLASWEKNVLSRPQAQTAMSPTPIRNGHRRQNPFLRHCFSNPHRSSRFPILSWLPALRNGPVLWISRANPVENLNSTQPLILSLGVRSENSLLCAPPDNPGNEINRREVPAYPTLSSFPGDCP